MDTNESNSEEYDNFLRKVNEVDSIIKGLQSGDAGVSELATKKADEFLKEMNEDLEIDEGQLKECYNRTVINTGSSEGAAGDQDTMTPELFMKSVEKDANERKRDKDERKEAAGRLKEQGNKAFRNGEYDRALNFYNKAIAEIKDSTVLYTNRALTYIRLGLYFRALNDTETALKLNGTSLKGHLYRAQCLFFIGEHQEAEDILGRALKIHPDQEAFITECKAKWSESEPVEFK